MRRAADFDVGFSGMDPFPSALLSSRCKTVILSGVATA
jgi:hypothetical protein